MSGLKTEAAGCARRAWRCSVMTDGDGGARERREKPVEPPLLQMYERRGGRVGESQGSQRRVLLRVAMLTTSGQEAKQKGGSQPTGREEDGHG